MSNIDDKLNEVLNIADEVLEKQVKEEKNPLEIANEPPKPVAPENAEVDTDFDTGRNELYKVLEKGNTAIDGILNLAKEGDTIVVVAGMPFGISGSTNSIRVVEI